MEKQKNIPLLSTKITRKLTQESADHNSLMNFYSSISRDKSGAPKRWRMSSPLRINDEEFINSNRLSMGATKTTPNSSQENSGERKSRSSLPSSKKLQNVRKEPRSRDGSSSDQNSSRESSLENHDKIKGEKNENELKQDKLRKTLLKDKNQNKRSASNDSLKHLKHLVNSENYMLEKDAAKTQRGRRPKSLDLLSKTINGDDDKFKSPDPLTPCNVDVKRRKGRPKETPPTLVAETPIDHNIGESIVNFECDTKEKAVVKQRPARQSKRKEMTKFTASKFKRYGQIKHFDGRALHQYTSKIKQNIVNRGFKKLPKLKVVKTTTKDSDSLNEPEEANNEKSKPVNQQPFKTKKIGRPLGAKNKPKLVSSFMTAHKYADHAKMAGESIGPPFLKKKSRKSNGVKNKTKFVKKNTLETICNNSVENGFVSDKNELSKKLEIMNCPLTGKDNESLDNISEVLNDKKETEVNSCEISTVENKDIDKEFDALCEIVINRDSIDDCIDSVLNKVMNDTLLPPVKRIKRPFRTESLKGNGKVKSAGKLKKEIKTTGIRKKKKLLAAHAINTDCIESLAHLAANDLRRKLQSKLILKLSSSLSPTSDQGIIKEDKSEVVLMTNCGSFKSLTHSDINESEKDIMKMELYGTIHPKHESEQNVNVANDIECSVQEQSADNTFKSMNIQNLSALIEQKRVTKGDTEKIIGKPKKGRFGKFGSDHKDFSKSDSESICSELSTHSFNSIKPHSEKQILILGEGNLDSDGNTVRTRQRFEIVPGKKRKRTLSGEFDLLDEKQLRKKRKKSEKNKEIDEQAEMSSHDQALSKQVESQDGHSPKPKVKDAGIKKKYASPIRPVHRIRLLKQSPFLSKVRKKRVVLKKQNKTCSQRQVCISDIHDSTLKREIVNSLESCDKLPATDKAGSLEKNIFENLAHVNYQKRKTVSLKPMLNAGDRNSEIMCIDKVKDELIDALQIISKSDLHASTIQTEYVENLESPVEGKSHAERYVTDLLVDLLNDVINKVEINIEEHGISSRVTSVYPPIADMHDSDTDASVPFKKRQNKALQRKMILEKARQCRKFGVRHSKTGKLKKIQKATARKSSKPEQIKVKCDAIKKTFNQSAPRQFELRQKISRSPLENLALKQSLEENEYFKNEAQKAIRKEAKMKSKLPLVNFIQETVESVHQALDQDIKLDNKSEQMPIVETKYNIETMLQQCTPCSIVLNDFIKKLQQAQSKIIPEVDSDVESSETENILSPLSEFENNISSVVENETLNIQDFNPDQGNSSGEMLEGNMVQSQSISGGQEEMSTFKVTPSSNVSASEIDQVNQQSTEIQETNDMSAIDKEKIEIAKPSEISLEINAGVVNSVSGTDQVTPKVSFKRNTGRKQAKMKILHSSFIPEQQTARKTVPPLKIKLKGGASTRRKTYMVESPINQMAESSCVPKVEKKRPKICKLESASGKQNKIHHKRGKRSPAVGMTRAKRAKTSQIQTVAQEKQNALQADRYEANYMLVIQEKEKVKQNLMNFTNTLSPKVKAVTPLTESAPVETASNFSLVSQENKLAGSELTNTSFFQAYSKADNNTFTYQPVFAMSATQNVVNTVDHSMAKVVTEASDVQYLCSQCENVTCKSEEAIIKHYQNVHPGAEFMYKPLLEDTAAEEIKATETKDFKPDVNDDNSKTYGGAENYMEDSDEFGSLNLKIVDVVSLKDQVNALDDELNQDSFCKSDVYSRTDIVQKNAIATTELKIPQYSVLGLSSLNHPELQKQLLQQTNLAVQQKKTTHSAKVGNTFKCEKCNVHAPLLAAMVAHLRNSHKDIPRLFQCPYCKEMEAETEALIHLHIRRNHPTDNPNPPVALSESAKKNLRTLLVQLPDNYKLSDNNLIEKDIYMCLNCKVHMPSLEAIYEHLEQLHPEVFVFVCPFCKLFKSKSEEIVGKHVISDHQRALDVNISLGFDENQYCRIQCLVKEKNRNAQKSPHPQTQRLQSPVSMCPTSLPVSQTLHLQPHTSDSRPAVSHSNELFCTTSVNSNAQQTVTSTNIHLTSLSNKCASQQQQQQKKKKNLLESIQQLTMQKQMEQGLLSRSSASPLPPNFSYVNTMKIVNSGAPPPLMRAPPPLIRYDQLTKVPASQSVLFGPPIQATTSMNNYSQTFSLPNISSAMSSAMQSLNTFPSVSTDSNVQPAQRKIKSSLFDTSDLDTVKLVPKPVLNVPVVAKGSNKMQFQQGIISKPHTSLSKPETGTPLDLSKNSPSHSPNPLPNQLPQPHEISMVPRGVNPEIFKVFNLRPQMQQVPRPNVSLQGPLQQFVAQPILMPQQVRQNTPSTLAYRPAGPHLISTSMPQFINMPLGTVIGNVVMSLSSIQQGMQTLSAGGPMQGIPAQIVQMSGQPVSAASAVTLINNYQPLQSTTTQSQMQINPQQLVNFSAVQSIKCPSCPNVKLSPAEMQKHIESYHGGLSVV